MKLPQSLLESPFFIFSDVNEFLSAIGEFADATEKTEIIRLASLKLPPITSYTALATMLGVSVGMLRSMALNPRRHYRSFVLQQGSKRRHIDAPRIILKVIQKWLSVHLAQIYQCPDNVFGFISGRSHIDAAKKHLKCNWVFSVDIESFFQTTSLSLVKEALMLVGYKEDSVDLLSKLFCLNEFLAQGAPSSPVLSNICFTEVDKILASYAATQEITYTRYADDLVFSGVGTCPEDLLEIIADSVSSKGWKLSTKKTKLSKKPNQLKVHGLLVHGSSVRLTKIYRNKVRAYQHLLSNNKVDDEDIHKLLGHINYVAFVDRVDAIE